MHQSLNLLLMAAAGGVAGQQRHPLTDIPPEAPGIEYKQWFPEHYTLDFPAGDQVRSSNSLFTFCLTPSIFCLIQCHTKCN